MSEASREQLDGVLDDYYENSIVGRIVKDRRGQNISPPSKVKKMIDGGPYTAHAAEKAGLIDRWPMRADYPDAMKAA